MGKSNRLGILFLSWIFSTVVSAASLELIRKIPHSGYSEGLDYSQGYLWNSLPKFLMKIDPKDGTVLQKFTPPTDYSESLMVFMGKMWNVSFVDDGIYSGKVSGQTLSLKRVGTTPERGAWGLTNDGKSLILTGSYSSKLYFLNPGSLTVEKTVTTQIRDLEDLAWDGTGIWSSSYTSHRGQIFRINVKTGEIPTFYDLSSPEECPLVDGIAYDGKGLWVTGKQCPSIYYFKLPKK